MTLYKHNVLDEIACILPVDDRTRPELRVVRVEEEAPEERQAVKRARRAERLSPVGARILEVMPAGAVMSSAAIRDAVEKRLGVAHDRRTIARSMLVLEMAGHVERAAQTKHCEPGLWRRV